MFVSVISQRLTLFYKMYWIPCDGLKDLVLSIFGPFYLLLVHSCSLMKHSITERETQKIFFNLWLNQTCSRLASSAFHTNGENSTAGPCVLFRKGE